MFRRNTTAMDRLDEADAVLQTLTNSLHVAHGFPAGRPMDSDTWAACTADQVRDFRAVERVADRFEQPARDAFDPRLCRGAHTWV